MRNRFGHPALPWTRVVQLHCVSMRSLGFHECVGFRGSQFGCRLTIEQIPSIVRYPDRAIVSDLTVRSGLNLQDKCPIPCRTPRNLRIGIWRPWAPWARLTKIGLSGVETDPIRGVGCTGVWGDIVIICIRHITVEVGAAVLRAAVAEELAEGHCDVVPRELMYMSKEESLEYVSRSMWFPVYSPLVHEK
ncbi:hypothetical protein L3X38_013374 [Prunus dulcis]|uniref:Uncharacterized protein n=1 Tax=Prunus dulcis TaxID=3755 RepID=A0AAD4WNV1_PRUDU|nr:hypothetical protein L3X38_013374 [Prunus dulcis]